MSDVPEQIRASFTHHGMEAEFKARAPREVRVLAVATAVGIVLPMLPMAVLIWAGTQHPDWVNALFGPVMVGVVLTLIAQVTVGPALFRWAAKPADIVLHIDERTLSWTRDGERNAFDLSHIRDIEALPGEIRVESTTQTNRLPCSGLKEPAVVWLDQRMREAWTNRQSAMKEDPLERAERRKIGRLVDKT